MNCHGSKSVGRPSAPSMMSAGDVSAVQRLKWGEVGHSMCVIRCEVPDCSRSTSKSAMYDPLDKKVIYEILPDIE